MSIIIYCFDNNIDLPKLKSVSFKEESFYNNESVTFSSMLMIGFIIIDLPKLNNFIVNENAFKYSKRMILSGKNRYLLIKQTYQNSIVSYQKPTRLLKLLYYA